MTKVTNDSFADEPFYVRYTELEQFNMGNCYGLIKEGYLRSLNDKGVDYEKFKSSLTSIISTPNDKFNIYLATLKDIYDHLVYVEDILEQYPDRKNMVSTSGIPSY